jgi:type VI secretion system secreted protein Hcp
MAKLLTSTHSFLQTRKGWMLVLVAAVLYGLPLFVFNGFGAAFDAFLKIEGIKGESADTDHKEWILIESFSWGMTQTGATSGGGGGGAGKVSVHDISITKSVDKSSPLLMLQCCTGQHIPEALLSYTKETPRGPVEYLKIKLNDILVSGYKFHGGGNDAMPVDSLSLNFTKIEMTYMQHDPDGNLVDTVTAACDFTPTTPTGQ